MKVLLTPLRGAGTSNKIWDARWVIKRQPLPRSIPDKSHQINAKNAEIHDAVSVRDREAAACSGEDG
jgi:hypothetical protein